MIVLRFFFFFFCDCLRVYTLPKDREKYKKFVETSSKNAGILLTHCGKYAKFSASCNSSKLTCITNFY